MNLFFFVYDQPVSRLLAIHPHVHFHIYFHVDVYRTENYKDMYKDEDIDTDKWKRIFEVNISF